jgi:hypothetical protein
MSLPLRPLGRADLRRSRGHPRIIGSLSAFPEPSLIPPQLFGATQEEGLTVADLPERIKTLKAGQTIEAAPQRSGTRRSSAEEPMTARIRRKAEEVVDSGVEETSHQDLLARERRTANGRG